MKPRLNVVPRQVEFGDTVPAALGSSGGALPDVAWEPPLPGQRRALGSWNEYMALASRVVGRFHGHFALRHFDYEHPVRLQPGTPRRLKRAYVTPVAYTEWGAADAPVLLCCGGVANVAMRFHYLASDLADRWRVVCMDWLGRGRSGWLAAEEDYSLATYAEQLRQMIRHLAGEPGPGAAGGPAGPAGRARRGVGGGRGVTVLGSSMGGSAAIELIAREPKLVERLILNDVGPHIPARRRRRRAEAIARHYVFRDPAELLRRVGASNKNDGPVSDDIRFNLSFHQTRWSDEESGRVYRHDVRAMQAYRRGSRQSVVQWAEWQHVRCPVLLIHGMQSDALLPPTLERMRRGKAVTVMHVPDTGHTPLLADRNQIGFIRQWLAGEIPAGEEWSVLHAPARDPYPGSPIPFAPASALR
ncbi:MAG: alpha/beta hydrolase [Burkholderiales bacterium]|nr:alpha/beta hydrolase [Burkholderiales bacterium]